MDEQPLVSIVTPSFGSGRYIERTIKSVLSQDYPRIEYLVMDGGSSDETISILRRYEGRLRYVSEPDGGAADAINRGFRQCSGEIFAWLSADDLYRPGAVRAMVRHFACSPAVDVIYGAAVWIDENGSEIGPYPTRSAYLAEMFQQECGICQPATFMRRGAFARAGMLNPELHFAFDYDLWIRLSAIARFLCVPEVIAASRMHRLNKSLGGRRRVFEENMALLTRHYGYVPLNWVYGYLAFRRDGRDQFYEPLGDYPLTYLASLPVGLAYNRRKMIRYFREWSSKLTFQRISSLARPWRRS